MASNPKKIEGFSLLSSAETFDPLDFKDQTRIKQKEQFQKQIKTYVTLLAIILFQILLLLFLSYKKTQATRSHDDIQMQISSYDKQIQNNTVQLENLNKNYEEMNIKHQDILHQHQEKLDNLNELKANYQQLINDYKEKRLQTISNPQKGNVITMSTILENEQDLALIESWLSIGDDYDYANWQLIYKATIDGDIASKFHQKVGNHKPTMILIETKKGSRFGGYTAQGWGSPIHSEGRQDENAFLFSLSSREKYPVIDPHYSIFASSDSLPVFGVGDISIIHQFLKRGNLCQSQFPTTFGSNIGSTDEEKKSQAIQFALTDGESNFQIDELEVFVLK